MRNGEDPTTLTQMAQGQLELDSGSEEEEGPAPLGESSCTSVRPSFCTMVRLGSIVRFGNSKEWFGDVELGIEMAYFQQPGSFDCRRRYKQLACQYRLADAVADAVKAPCRSVCEDFAARCPGADIQCNSYPQDKCLMIDLLTDGAVSSTTVSSFVLVSSAIIFMMM